MKAEKIKRIKRPAGIDLGVYYTHRGEFQKAEKTLNIAAAKDPRSPEPVVKLAYVKRLKGDLPSAKELLKEAIGKSPESSGRIMAELGRIACLEGFYGAGAQMFLAGTAKDAPFGLLAASLRLSGDKAAALEAAGKAGSKRASVLLARERMLLARSARSKASYGRALRASFEEAAEASLEYISCGMYKDAKAVAEDALKYHKANIILCLLKGFSKEKLECGCAAKAIYKKAAGMPVIYDHPMRVEFLNVLGRALNYTLDDPAVFELIGDFMAQKKRYGEALDYFKAAEKRGSRSKELPVRMVLCAKKIKKSEKTKMI